MIFIEFDRFLKTFVDFFRVCKFIDIYIYIYIFFFYLKIFIDFCGVFFFNLWMTFMDFYFKRLRL